MSLDYQEEYEAITLIYGGLCVLSNQEANLLLKKVYQALKPGGYFVFDVFTKHYFTKSKDCDWFVMTKDGFWQEKEHMVLMDSYHYTKEKTRLKRYIIIDSQGRLRTCHMWYHYFNKESIFKLVQDNGFIIKEIFADLQGGKYIKNSPWISLVVQKE